MILRSMEHRFVRIEAAKPISPQNSTSSSPSTAAPPAKRRRAAVTLACDVCRRKKTRCEGSRPSCQSCRRAGLACNYSQRGLIEAENARDASTLQKLRSLPPLEAGRLLETIRTNDQEEALTASPCLATVLWGHLSPTRNQFEFELMIRHPISYPPLFPLEAASLPLESLLRPLRIVVERQEPESYSPSYPSPDQPSAKPYSNEVSIKCFPERPLVDERLRDAHIRHWTNVQIPDQLAAHILSLYIETDYQVLPMFNLDLFITDLIHNKPYFCSKFLVNSLFSWICQTYSAINVEASDFGKQFFSEAQEMVLDGPQLFTLTAVSALQFLCLAALGYGHDDLGLEYLRKGVSIGTDMGLFGRDLGKETASTWLGNQDEWRRSASYTAWGVHNWVSLCGLRYHSAEIMAPPRIPMPGTLDVGPPGERIGTAEASTHVQVFKASCELWMLSSEIRQSWQPNAITALDFRDETCNLFLRCLKWADSLPLDLVRSEHINHAVTMLHIYFHVIIVDMSRQVPDEPEEAFPMPPFETKRVTPRAIHTASMNQLRRLLLAFRFSFRLASLSFMSQTVLIYVANDVLLASDDAEELDRQFYLRACFAGLEDLYGSYRQTWCVMKGLLSMSLKCGAVGVEEAGRIMREMKVLGQHHQNPGDAKGTSMMDLELASTDPSAAQVHRLAEQFDDLLLNRRNVSR